MAGFPQAIGTLSDYQEHLFNPNTNAPYGTTMLQEYSNLSQLPGIEIPGLGAEHIVFPFESGTD